MATRARLRLFSRNKSGSQHSMSLDDKSKASSSPAQSEKHESLYSTISLKDRSSKTKSTAKKAKSSKLSSKASKDDTSKLSTNEDDNRNSSSRERSIKPSKDDSRSRAEFSTSFEDDKSSAHPSKTIKTKKSSSSSNASDKQSTYSTTYSKTESPEEANSKSGQSGISETPSKVEDNSSKFASSTLKGRSSEKSSVESSVIGSVSDSQNANEYADYETGTTSSNDQDALSGQPISEKESRQRSVPGNPKDTRVRIAIPISDAQNFQQSAGGEENYLVILPNKPTNPFFRKTREIAYKFPIRKKLATCRQAPVVVWNPYREKGRKSVQAPSLVRFSKTDHQNYPGRQPRNSSTNNNNNNNNSNNNNNNNNNNNSSSQYYEEPYDVYDPHTGYSIGSGGGDSAGDSGQGGGRYSYFEDHPSDFREIPSAAEFSRERKSQEFRRSQLSRYSQNNRHPNSSRKRNSRDDSYRRRSSSARVSPERNSLSYDGSRNNRRRVTFAGDSHEREVFRYSSGESDEYLNRSSDYRHEDFESHKSSLNTSNQVGHELSRNYDPRLSFEEEYPSYYDYEDEKDNDFNDIPDCRCLPDDYDMQHSYNFEPPTAPQATFKNGNRYCSCCCASKSQETGRCQSSNQLNSNQPLYNYSQNDPNISRCYNSSSRSGYNYNPNCRKQSSNMPDKGLELRSQNDYSRGSDFSINSIGYTERQISRPNSQFNIHVQSSGHGFNSFPGNKENTTTCHCSNSYQNLPEIGHQNYTKADSRSYYEKNGCEIPWYKKCPKRERNLYKFSQNDLFNHANNIEQNANCHCKYDQKPGSDFKLSSRIEPPTCCRSVNTDISIEIISEEPKNLAASQNELQIRNTIRSYNDERPSCNRNNERTNSPLNSVGINTYTPRNCLCRSRNEKFGNRSYEKDQTFRGDVGNQSHQICLTNGSDVSSGRCNCKNDNEGQQFQQQKLQNSANTSINGCFCEWSSSNPHEKKVRCFCSKSMRPGNFQSQKNVTFGESVDAKFHRNDQDRFGWFPGKEIPERVEYRYSVRSSSMVSPRGSSVECCNTSETVALRRMLPAERKDYYRQCQSEMVASCC